MHEETQFIKKYEKFESRLVNLYWKKNSLWYLQFKKFTDEEFKEIKGYHGFYFISNYGRVISFHRKNPVVRKYSFRHGYFCIALHLDGVKQYHFIHNLVYATFVRPLKPGRRVIHKNRVTTDNYYKNLNRVRISSLTKVIRRKKFTYTLYDQIEAEAAYQAGNTVPVLQFEKSGIFIKEYPSVKEASVRNGIDCKSLIKCMTGRFNTTGGYRWRYKKDKAFSNGIKDIGPLQRQFFNDGHAVVRFDLEGRFINEYPNIAGATKALKIKTSTISICASGHCKTAGGYQWRYREDPLFKDGIVNIDPVSPYINPFRRPVLQFTLEGNFVKEYPSIYAAAGELGINASNINSCIAGKIKSCGDSQWKYKSDPLFTDGIVSIGPVEYPDYHKAEPVLQFTGKGAFVKEYDSVASAAAEFKVSIFTLYNCIRGKIKTCSGFQWRYKRDLPVQKEGGTPNMRPYNGKIKNKYSPVLQFSPKEEYMTGYSSVKHAEKATAINAKAIYLCLSGATKTAGGFKWRSARHKILKNGVPDIPPVQYPHINASRPVLQFNKKGNYLKEYPTALEAASEVGIPLKRIQLCIKGEIKSAGGFRWKRKGRNTLIEHDEKKRDTTPKPVVQFQPGGEIIREYSSVREAAKKSGISKNVISNCVKGKTAIAGGFQWKYRNDPVLKNGIRNIPEVKTCDFFVKPVLQFDLMGNFIAEYLSPGRAKAVLGISDKAINKCLRGEDKTAGKYQWKHKNDPLFKNGIVNIEAVEKIEQYNATPVLQFDLDGKFVRKYPNIKEAVKNVGIKIPNIRSCFKGRSKTAGGFQWKSIHDPAFKNGITDIAPVDIKISNRAKAVLQFDLSGKLLNEFFSIGNAGKITGISHSAIGKCAKGKLKTSGGFTWKFKKIGK